MKKLLFLFTAFYSIQAIAQPYTISFSGAGLLTVKVQNLTTGIVVDVPAGDVLLLSITTGIPEVNERFSRMKIYPNPMTDKSTLEILPPLAGDAVISVLDMTGKILVQFKSFMEKSSQEFTLSGMKSGSYVINVQGNGYQLSEKLLSNGESNGIAIYKRTGNNIQSVGEKKESKMDSKGVQGSVNMTYTAGQRLKYTAVSGNNSTVMTDIPTADKTVNFSFTVCEDGDNNYYPVVQIGTQLWMVENLKTTHYTDGTAIPLVNTASAWDVLTSTSKAYCWYNDDIANKATYGALYTWSAAMNGAASSGANPSTVQGVCPTGWHLPSDAEWTQMENYLADNGYNFDGTTGGGSAKIAKSLASTSGWTSSSITGAVGSTEKPAYRNKSGFTALPGGNRYSDGMFAFIGYSGFWWSTTIEVEAKYILRDMYYDHINVSRYNGNQEYGFSVRCLSD